MRILESGIQRAPKPCTLATMKLLQSQRVYMTNLKEFIVTVWTKDNSLTETFHVLQ